MAKAGFSEKGAIELAVIGLLLVLQRDDVTDAERRCVRIRRPDSGLTRLLLACC